MVFQENFSIRYTFHCANKYKWNLTFFTRNCWLWFIISLNFDSDNPTFINNFLNYATVFPNYFANKNTRNLNRLFAIL